LERILHPVSFLIPQKDCKIYYFIEPLKEKNASRKADTPFIRYDPIQKKPLRENERQNFEAGYACIQLVL